MVISSPVTVRSPVTTASLPIVVVPVAAPIAVAVDAPPMFKVVAFVLRRLAVAAVVVMSPPLIAISPVTVTSVSSFTRAVDSTQPEPFQRRVLLALVPSAIVPVTVPHCGSAAAPCVCKYWPLVPAPSLAQSVPS